MYNCLLKVALLKHSVRHLQSVAVVAETSVIVKVADAFDVFDKFFACLDMPEEHRKYEWYTTECEITSVTEFNANSQLAEELNEDNPFNIPAWVKPTVSKIWHTVNEWKYSGCIKC